MQKLDASIHFTTRFQDFKELTDKLDKWLEENKYTINLVDTPNFARLHHCFLRRSEVERLGYSTKVIDYLSKFHCISWSGASEKDLLTDRADMLANLKRLNGVAIFLGDLSGGVSEELSLAELIGVDIIKIK